MHRNLTNKTTRIEELQNYLAWWITKTTECVMPKAKVTPAFVTICDSACFLLFSHEYKYVFSN